MIREDCLYYEKCKDMGATIDWCRNYPHLNFDCEKCERYIEKNFVQVVRCKDCKHYYSWGAPLVGGFCFHDGMPMLNIEPMHYCAWGERKDDGNNDRN